MDYRLLLFKMALRLGPALVMIVSFVALMLGLIFSAIHIDQSLFIKPQERKFDESIIVDNKIGDLIWFIQISDIHINIESPDRERDFNDFANTYIDYIKPHAVLVTGDITDGRVPKTIIGTGPQVHDWQAYSSTVVNSGALNKTLWLDIRGNHDNFNVYQPDDPNTLYRQYSIQGKKNPRNQFNILSHNDKNYTFIGVDMVQKPGVRGPFNFLGIVDNDDIDELKKYKEHAALYDSQYTIWYGHYPTSSVENRLRNLRDMIDGPYLCGHYHTIGNLVTEMYANQQNGYLEAEIGDWKHNRVLRIGAIDHQMFSMVDFKFKKWPVALMTNPKNAEARMPKYEPRQRIVKSKFIRVIAFSDVPISKVEISFDEKAYTRMTHESGPLYVLEWDSSQFSKGIHKAEIIVTDASGKSEKYQQNIIIEEDLSSHYTFGGMALLRLPYKTMILSNYYFLVILCVLPLLALRLIKPHKEDSKFEKYYKGTFLHNLFLMVKINKIFYPIILIPIYISIGK